MNPTILLVEDDPNDLELTLRAFRCISLVDEIAVARDGVEALDYLFAAGNHAARNPSEKPAVILLDLNLPRIGGIDVLKKIKADDRTRDIPVAILTSSQWDILAAECKRLGAEAVLAKPANPDGFKELAAWLKNFSQPVSDSR